MFGRSNKKNPAHVDHNAFFHCREHIKEKFLNDLRKIREQHTGEALAKVSSILTFFSDGFENCSISDVFSLEQNYKYFL